MSHGKSTKHKKSTGNSYAIVSIQLFPMVGKDGNKKEHSFTVVMEASVTQDSLDVANNDTNVYFTLCVPPLPVQAKDPTAQA